MAIGIGIITYNRQRELIRTAGAVMWHTKLPYYLVVADDGSTDDTVDHCKVGGVNVVTGTNRGVCWNKNRALHALLKYTDADPIILLEDDCYPTKIGWESEWIRAAKLHHHVNYAHTAWPANWCRGGSGTADDPWLTWEITGQATVTSREALTRVGYLNSKFKGYGYGHIEWTERFCKLGFIKRNSVPCMRGDLVMEEAKTFRNLDDMYRNCALAEDLRQRPVTCWPPCHKEELQTLNDEVYAGCCLDEHRLTRRG